MVDDMIVGDLVKALRSETGEKSKTHSAIVSRVDGDGAVWVHVNGSYSETPTASSASEVKPGDLVNVEWRNNKLYILGNPSNPSAGGLRVNTIEQSATHAQEIAEGVGGSAVDAKETAAEAESKAEDALSQVGASITTDTLHYLATSASSGVTIHTPGGPTTVQSMESTAR